MKVQAPSLGARLAPAAYQQLIARSRAALESITPPGSVIAVISKGDPSMLTLTGREGRHFPATASGEYAGHHPADGVDAAERMLTARNAGASHLFVPVTSAWWLDHYMELAKYLATNATLAWNDAEVGDLYAFGTETTAQLESEAFEPSLPSADSLQLSHLVHHLLPLESTLILASAGPMAANLILGQRQLWTWDLDGEARTPYIHQLEMMRARGAQFLVVPAAVLDTLQRRVALRNHIGATCRQLVHQARVCTVFDLRAPRP